MRFCSGLYQGEIEFFLETEQFSFDSFWHIINDVVKPDQVNRVQVTSWTEARSFEKAGLVFYFEEYYDETPSRFTLRLLPFGSNHSSEEIQKLCELVGQLERHLEQLGLQ